MTSRFDDERWAQFDQPTLLDDCEPAWDDPWPDDPPPRPVRDCITDLANYQPNNQ